MQALFFLERQFQVRELQTDDGGIFSENECNEPAASRTDSGFFFLPKINCKLSSENLNFG